MVYTYIVKAFNGEEREAYATAKSLTEAMSYFGQYVKRITLERNIAYENGTSFQAHTVILIEGREGTEGQHFFNEVCATKFEALRD